MTHDEEHHRFAFANLSLLMPDAVEAEKQGLIGVDHVAYTYSTVDELFENYRQLKARDIKPYWCVHHGITISLHYADPHWNQIEFQVDCFSSNEEANALMSGPNAGTLQIAANATRATCAKIA